MNQSRRPLTALVLVGLTAVAWPAPAMEAPGPALQVAHELDVDVGRDAGLRRVRLLADDRRYAAVLEIVRPGDPPALQRLDVEVQEPPSGAALPQVVVEDLNGDGLRDLMVRSWAGATGNRGYVAWRFDAMLGAYVAIPPFAELSRPEVEPGGACLRSRHGGGAAGMIYTAQRWCWRGGELELTWEQHQDIDAEGAATRVTRELRDGVMVEIERRTGIDPAADDAGAGDGSAPRR